MFLLQGFMLFRAQFFDETTVCADHAPFLRQKKKVKISISQNYPIKASVGGNEYSGLKNIGVSMDAVSSTWSS